MLGSVEAVTDAIAASVPAYAAATRAALRTSRDGVLAVPTPDAAAFPEPTAAVPDRIRYDYRLVLTRKLYDRAVGTAKSPSLAKLAPSSAAHLNPLDLDRLGVAAGSEIRVDRTRGTVVLPVVADSGVPRGSLQVPFNVPGPSVTGIIDASAPVSDVRVERL